MEEDYEDGEEYEYDPRMCVLVGSGTPWDDAQWSPPVDTGIAHLNSFAGLASDENHSNEPMIDSLNNWAHSVTDATEKTSQKERKLKGNQKIKIKISSVEDLDAIKALPTDLAALDRIAKKSPGRPPS